MQNVHRIFLLTGLVVALAACTRNDIEFGSAPENYFTSIVFTDTVEAKLSTVIQDSFITNTARSFLVGNFRDPQLGLLKTSAYFQFDIPSSSTDIPQSAIYDSACIIIRFNRYYYGDTVPSKTITVHELGEDMALSYNDKLYNTSSFMVKNPSLAEKAVYIRPAADDSVNIRINDTKGLDLFTRLKNKADEITSQENFLRYFKGVRVSVKESDLSAIHGIKGSAAAVTLRVYFHTNTPYPDEQFIDFPSLQNAFSFNQIIADRTGTSLEQATGTGNGLKILAAETSGNMAFNQTGTGLRMKINFPTLGKILETENYVRLQKAVLILRPVPSSYDEFALKLPSSVYLTQTDGTNTEGASITDSSGNAIQYVGPDPDYIFKAGTHYRFDVTSSVSQLLATTGRDDFGFFLMENSPDTAIQVNRGVFGSRYHNDVKAQLLLTVVVINK